MATLTSFKNQTEYVVVGGMAQVCWSIQGLALCFLLVDNKLRKVHKVDSASIIASKSTLNVRIIVLGFFSFTTKSLNIRCSSLGPSSTKHARMKPVSIRTNGLATTPVSIKTEISNRINNSTLKVPKAPENY